MNSLLHSVPILLVEAVAVLFIGLICWYGPAWVADRKLPFYHGLRKLADHRVWAPVSIFLIPVLLAVLIGFIRQPVPGVHDEFSYLLSAQIFAGGRLAAESPSFPEHFQTFHTLLTPTYQSKYPPVQALFLALGILLGKAPVLGVWICGGLNALATWWAAKGWLSHKWAWLAGFMIGVHAYIRFFWGQSLYGGDAAMLGGALAIGAFARIPHRANVWTWTAFGLGTILLANSRPFEGFLTVAALWLTILWRTLNTPGMLREIAKPAFCAYLVVGAAGGALMAVYNSAVTQNPAKMPYMLYEGQFATSPVFVGGTAKQPDPNLPPDIYAFYENDRVRYERITGSLSEFVSEKTSKTYARMAELVRPLLLIPLCAGFLCWRRRGFAFVCITPIILYAIANLSVWNSSRYYAPFLPFIYIAVVMGLRECVLRLPTARRRTTCLAGWVTLQVGLVAVIFAAVALFESRADLASRGWRWKRHDIEQTLSEKSGRHVVFVKYSEKHDHDHGWIFNGPQIDQQKVVWARDLGADGNRSLMDAFNQHTFWQVSADKKLPKLEAYPAE